MILPDKSPRPLLSSLLLGAVLIFVIAYALAWAADLLRQAWPVLAIAGGVIALGWGVWRFVRWRSQRW